MVKAWEAFRDHYREMTEVLNNFRECWNLEQAEPAWNHPQAQLFDSVLRNFPHLRCRDITTATVIETFLPKYQDASIQSVKTDFVVTLYSDKGSPFREAIAQKIGDPALQGGKSINASTYTPLIFEPAAMFVETKISRGLTKAQLQEGAWVASTFSALRRLSSQRHCMPAVIVTDHT